MERAEVQDWLDRYVAAWRSYDRAAIEALFTDDCEYRYHPYEEPPVVGSKAIADGWLAEQDKPGSWEASYRPGLIEGEKAMATGKTSYDNGRVYWNLWELEFASDGRCQRFVEWFMRQPKPPVLT